MHTPASAVHIWLEGDQWIIRIPDGQTLSIPAGAANRLQSILVGRAAKHTRIGLAGSPTQEQMDAWKQVDDRGFIDETWEERLRNAGARKRAEEEKRKEKERVQLLKRVEQRRKAKEADDLLQEIGL